jgi:hypothetical protein
MSLLHSYTLLVGGHTQFSQARAQESMLERRKNALNTLFGVMPWKSQVRAKTVEERSPELKELLLDADVIAPKRVTGTSPVFSHVSFIHDCVCVCVCVCMCMYFSSCSCMVYYRVSVLRLVHAFLCLYGVVRLLFGVVIIQFSCWQLLVGCCPMFDPV